jgi:hypothetical protein
VEDKNMGRYSLVVRPGYRAKIKITFGTTQECSLGIDQLEGPTLAAFSNWRPDGGGSWVPDPSEHRWQSEDNEGESAKIYIIHGANKWTPPNPGAPWLESTLRALYFTETNIILGFEAGAQLFPFGSPQDPPDDFNDIVVTIILERFA